MDCHMVVVPAQSGEVVGMMTSAICEPGDVVRLETISAVTAVDDTPAITMGNVLSNCRWDRTGGR